SSAPSYAIQSQEELAQELADPDLLVEERRPAHPQRTRGLRLRRLGDEARFEDAAPLLRQALGAEARDPLARDRRRFEARGLPAFFREAGRRARGHLALLAALAIDGAVAGHRGQPRPEGAPLEARPDAGVGDDAVKYFVHDRLLVGPLQDATHGPVDGGEMLDVALPHHRRIAGVELVEPT